MSTVQELLHVFSTEYARTPQGASPLYRRVENCILAVIGRGDIGPDDALPPERDLAQALEVSRVTLRKAVGNLVSQAVLVQRHGAGTFVAGRVEQPLSKLTGFTEDMKGRGLATGVNWLEKSLGAATPDEASALNIAPGSGVARLYRIRYANDKPMCIELAVLPADILPDPETVDISLYAKLEARHARPVKARQRLRAQLLEMEQARLLEVAAGAACLYIERLSYLGSGDAIEFVRSWYRGDAYDFVADLHF